MRRAAAAVLAMMLLTPFPVVAEEPSPGPDTTPPADLDLRPMLRRIRTFLGALPTWHDELRGSLDPSSGCGPAVLPTWDDSEPEGVPFGRATDPPLRATGDVLSLEQARERGFRATVPTETKGRELQLVKAGGSSVVQVYSKTRVRRRDTLDDVMADGGVYIYESTADKNVGRTALAVLGDKAAEIRIGPYQASFSHASPDSNGIRTYRIYWSDPQDGHMVMGNVDDPLDLIDIARSMVCD